MSAPSAVAKRFAETQRVIAALRSLQLEEFVRAAVVAEFELLRFVGLAIVSGG
jgi:hypothetical protein